MNSTPAQVATSTTALKTFDQAIADRLAYVAEVEQQRQLAELERQRIIEEGKADFLLALTEHFASQYGFEADLATLNPRVTHDSGSSRSYNIWMDIEPNQDDDGTIKAGSVTMLYTRSPEELRRPNIKFNWKARRYIYSAALGIAGDSSPIVYAYESSDFIEAVVYAKTGK